MGVSGVSQPQPASPAENRSSPSQSHAEAARGFESATNAAKTAEKNLLDESAVSTDQPQPLPGPEVTITKEGDRTVVDAGKDNDVLVVTQRADGGVDIQVNRDTFLPGKVYSLTAEQAAKLTIRGGTGHDTVRLNNITHDVRIEGGAGNDTLFGSLGNDQLFGGEGNDYIEGQDGNDIISGGVGRDTLYGLDGVDVIDGGAGKDYLDGGAGRDHMNGREGDDALSGGLGNDVLTGGAGNDTLIAGAGLDHLIDTEAGDADKIFAEAADRVTADAGATRIAVDMSRRNAAGTAPGSSIGIHGSLAFQKRVASDLETLRSMPDGQALLISIDNSGQPTRIFQTSGGNTASGNFFAPGPATVNYNPSRVQLPGAAAYRTRPPIVGLHHELLHAQDLTYGSGAPGTTVQPGQAQPTRNIELSVVGLPYDRDGDGVADPNDRAITENSFRADLNLENRDRY